MKRRLLLVSLLILALLLGSCTHHEKYHRQNELHDQIAELERCVLAEMGDYICFDEPVIKDDIRRIDISIVFISEYTLDEEQIASYPPMAVMEDARAMIFDFLTEDPQYFPDDYLVCFQVVIPPDGSSLSSVVYNTVGEWTNYVANYQYDEVCVVDYGYIATDDISNLEAHGIRAIILDDYSSDNIDELCDVIDALPELQEVVVHNSVASELADRRPDINVIGIN